MQLQPADHPLTDAEIGERFGGLLRAGAQAFREDMNYLVDIAEDWARAHRAPPPLTPEDRERRAMESQRRGMLTRERRAEQDVILRQAFADNRSSTDVAAELGVADATVLGRWRAMGLHASQRSRARVAGRSGRPPSALTEERERLVRQYRDEGVTQKVIAERLGISQAGVSYIRKRLGIT